LHPESSQRRSDSSGGLTPARIVAIGALIVAAALLAVAMFGGGGEYKVSAYFQNAGLLVKGDAVRVGGHVAGKVTGVELTNDSLAKVSMTVDDTIAPLHDGTRASIRLTSLPGTANRYVSLRPGPNNAAQIPDGGRIGSDSTSSAVELDELFDAFTPKTRRALQQLVQGSAAYYTGRSRELNASLKNLSPALAATSRLTHEVTLDQLVFRRLVVQTAGVVSAIAERRRDLTSLVSNANTAAGAIGDENLSLSRALLLLPGTLRKANTTFVNLRSTLNDLDPLVNVAKPATKDLPQFLADLRPLVADAAPTVRDLSALVRTPGPDNDLTNLTALQPKLQRQASQVFPATVRTLRRSQPVVETARVYTPELVGWFKDYGQSAASYDANGHFAKISPLVAPFVYSNGQLTSPPPGSNRLTGLATLLRHCPGSAVPPSPDGSAPFAVPGCDPSSVPPGP
jgi:phospholipid/cholesterol/gamma-HCH transport system substrate-binding protein